MSSLAGKSTMSPAGTIVYASRHGDLGGGELRMLEHLTLTRLPRERLSVVLGESGPFRERIEALGIPTETIPCSLAARRHVRWLRTVLARRRLRRHLARRRAAMIFCNTYDDLQLVGPVARAARIPVVWRSHADLFPYLSRLAARRRRAVVHVVDETATRILCTTEYDRALMGEAGLPERRVHVVPLGVDGGGYADAAPRGRELRRKLGFPADLPVLGFVARLVPQKGHAVFFEALARVVAERPRLRAVVVGDAGANGSDPDGFRHALQDLVERLGLGSTVVFTGFHDDIPAVMNTIDVFVHASLKEPFGSVIVEAMAAARPVIASATLGPQEIIRDGVTGLLTPPGDAGALATAILRILREPGLGRALAERGRAHAVATYDLRETIALLDHHFLEALG
jgi:glycosyltransferase involved in cell wall biosynthesis